MSQILKSIGDYLLGVFNFNIRRKLNGRKVIIPVRSGIKVGISGEKWMSDLLKILLNEFEGTFLDIGANLGQTLVKVKTIDPDRAYVGFDPNPSCINYLQHLRAVNKWKNVALVPTGIYAVDSLLTLFGRTDTDGSSTVINEFKAGSADDNQITKLVPLLSFSTINNTLKLKTVSAIKIDVEGAEIEVMEGMMSFIKNIRPLIILEVWQNNGDPEKIKRSTQLKGYLEEINYGSFSWVTPEGSANLANFNRMELGDSSIDNFLLVPHEQQEAVVKLINSSL